MVCVKYMKTLVVEAVVVGIVLSVVTAAVVRQYGLPKSTGGCVLAAFLCGTVVHLVFEVLNINRMYCVSGAACMK